MINDLFPTYALPPVARYAASELQTNTGAPMEIIGATLLGSMALGTQLLHDVRMPHGQVRPTVLSQLVIAESGDRKSTVQQLVLRPYYEFEAQCSLDKETHVSGESELRIWTQKCKQLERTISRLEIQGEDAQSERSQLSALQGSKPMQRQSQRLIFENMTSNALFEALRGDDRSIVILSDEAEGVYRSPLFRSGSLLNKGWDGADTLMLDRANRESVTSRRPRVSSFLMIQPSVWAKAVQKNGGILRDSGYFARMLPAFATSNQGFRPPSPKITSDQCLSTFHGAIHEKLGRFASQLHDTKKPQRTCLEFTAEASTQLREITQYLESQIAPGGRLHASRDFVSKATENVCRVAASLHCFSGYDDLHIGKETVASAADIVMWHGIQFELIFSPDGPLSLDEEKAAVLFHFLHKNYWAFNQCAPISEAFRNGPIRPKSRFDTCLERLIKTHRATVANDPSTSKPLITPFVRNLLI